MLDYFSGLNCDTNLKGGFMRSDTTLRDARKLFSRFRHRPFYRSVAMLSSALGLMLANGAMAQGVSLGGISMPPENPTVDANGVDVVSGTPTYQKLELSIGGDGIGALPLIRYFSGSWLRTNLDNDFTVSQDWLSLNSGSVLLGNSSESFYNYAARSPTGSIFTITSPGYDMSYTKKDGTYASFTHHNQYSSSPSGVSGRAFVDYIQYINGVRWTYHYLDQVFTAGGASGNISRVQSVTSNTGYQLKFYYSSNVTPTDTPSLQAWYKTTKVVAINNAEEYCSPTANTCSLSLPWHEVNYSVAPGYFLSVTDSTGAQTDYTNTGGVRYAGSGSINRSYTYSTVSVPCVTPGYPCTAQKVTSATIDGKTTSYAYSSGVGGYTTTSTGPSSEVNKYTSDVYLASDISGSNYSMGPVKEFVNALNKTYQYEYQVGVASLPADLTKVTMPEGNYIQYTRDADGNITQTLARSKTGSPANIVENRTIGAFAQPATITDPRGNVTSYTYDPTHGGVLTETGPAVGGIAPVKRYAYAQRYAWIKNSGGSYVQAAQPVWVRTEERFCMATATVSGACAGGSGDEVVTIYEYGPNSGPNNLQLRGQVVTANFVSRRTCYGYDRYGNKISETSPRANSFVSCP
jgi:hypothetical protein